LQVASCQLSDLLSYIQETWDLFASEIIKSLEMFA